MSECFPDEQEVKNFAEDIETTNKFVNGPIGEPNVNRVGANVRNLQTIRKEVIDIAVAAGTAYWVDTYSDLLAISGPTAGAVGVVTNDPAPQNNGYWMFDGADWERTDWQPVDTDDFNAAVTNLSERIDDEETARETADTALGERIDDEETARETADTALGERIDDEETARETADTALGERIDETQEDLSNETSIRTAQFAEVAPQDIAGGVAVASGNGRSLLRFDTDGTARIVRGVRTDVVEVDSTDEDGRAHLIRAISGTGVDPLVLAINLVSGLISLGALDQETLDRLKNDLDINSLVADIRQSLNLEIVNRDARMAEVAPQDIAGGVAVASGNGRSLLRFDTDGTLRIVSGVRPDTADADPGDESGKLYLLRADSGTGTDPLILAIDPDTGFLSLGALDQESLDRLKHDLNIDTSTSALGRKTVDQTITFIVQSGQSLSLGALGNQYDLSKGAFLSASPYTPYGWMLNTGMRGAMGGTLVPDQITDFVPAKDVWDARWNGNKTAIENRGQVPGSSMMARLAYLNEGNRTLTDMVYRGHGRGGRRISQLQANSGSFQNGYAELQRAISIAGAYGRPLRVPAVVWSHGEQERAPGNEPPATVSWYKDQLVTLLDSYNSYYLPLLPDGHPEIVMIMDQVAGNTQAEPVNPASIAQYEAMRDIPGFYMACPKYWMSLSDTVHGVPSSYAMIGEYYAQTFFEVCTKGNTTFRPTMPESIERDGTTITLTLKTPYGERIMFDTTTLPLQTNYGFEYDTADIVSVALEDADEGIIIIELSEAVGGVLGYAATGTGTSAGTRPGAWGNVRDMSTERSVTVPGAMLYNWLVVFQETVT